MNHKKEMAEMKEVPKRDYYNVRKVRCFVVYSNSIISIYSNFSMCHAASSWETIVEPQASMSLKLDWGVEMLGHEQ